MRIANGWQDYEMLDATEGNRLERWGEVLLVRPDPQAIWPRDPQCRAWAQAHATYHRSSAGGGSCRVSAISSSPAGSARSAAAVSG